MHRTPMDMDEQSSTTEAMAAKVKRFFALNNRKLAAATGMLRSPTARSQDLSLGEQSDKPSSSMTAEAQIPFVKTLQPESSAEPSHAKPSVGVSQSNDAQHQPQSSPSPYLAPFDNRASRLWDTAYDKVKIDHPELVSRYEEVLSRYLSQEDAEAKSKEKVDDAHSHHADDPSRARMDRVLEAWFAQQATAASLNDGWKAFIVLARDAWKKAPQASLPWTAACLGLQTAFDSPANQPRGVFPIMVFLFRRMDWYCRLSELLPRDYSLIEISVELRRLEYALLDLYRTVLLYCIGVACDGGDHEELSFTDPGSLKADLLDKESALPTTLGECLIEVQLRQLIKSANIDAWPELDEANTTEVDNGGEDTEEEPIELADKADQKTPLVQRIHDNGSFAHDANINNWLSDRSQFDKFRDWNPGEKNHLLWISGAPGSGKTTILATIVRQLLHEKKSSDTHYKNVYFFISGSGMPNSDNLASAVGSLVEQICQEQPDLKEHLDDKKESTGRQDFNSPSDFPTISEVLYAMISDDRFLPAYFVLDSADECSVESDCGDAGTNTLDQLLALVSAITNDSSKVRWLLSVDSAVIKVRPEDEQLHLDLDANPGALRPAAEHHISSSIQKLTSNSLQDSGFRLKVEGELLAKSAGNFLWVSLASKIIQTYGTPWNILHILSNLPSGVETLYKYALDEISRLPWGDAVYCERILQVTALAYRPLHVAELKNITRLPFEVELDLFIEKRCFTFLKVLDGMVYFSHRSARQFLESDIKTRTTTSQIHAKITLGCVGFLMELLDSTDKLEQLASHYATVQWMKHFSKIEQLNDEEETVKGVLKFLDGYFLPWLESLVSTKHPSRAFAQLLNLKTTLERKTTRHVKVNLCLQLVRDATRVIQLQQAFQIPPNLKVKNTLLFYPSESSIRQRYQPNSFPWLDLPPNIDRHSSSQLFALEGHEDWVRSCDYSPDGRFIVSSSDDYTIRIWDAQTGELQNVLESPDGWVYRVICSALGFIAAMVGRSVAIWDSTTHILRKKLAPFHLWQDAAGYLQDIAFSRDGTLLAAVGLETVSIWGIPSYERRAWEITGFDITSVTFSSDGSLLAVVGLPGIVTLLRTKDGELVGSFECEGYPLNPRFSPDSRYLAAGSTGTEFPVWDLKSNSKRPKMFAGHGDSVTTVSFSSDGARIASGSDDSEIRIWDLGSDETQQPVQVLKNHERDVLSVVFSPISSRYLASTSKESIVRLWDIDAERDMADTDAHHAQHLSPVNFVTLSPDGKTIASGCDDGRIYLWDGETGAHQRELKAPEEAGNDPPHSGQVIWLAFSPDSSTLVSTAPESKFILWYIQSGTGMCPLIGHQDWVRCAVFSPNGMQVASASDDRTVRLWDVRPPDGEDGDSRHRKVVYRGHSDYVHCLAFSLNGRYLASAGDDSQIRVRDLALKEDSEYEDLDKVLGPSPPSRSLAFFPDGERIVSASNDWQLKIWDRRSGQCLQTIKAKKETYCSMNFYKNLTDWILTEAGAQLLHTSGRPLPLPLWYLYGTNTVNNNESWITYNGHNLVFLPKQYCLSSDGTSAAFVQGHKVVIGCESGALLLFKFRKNVIPDPLGKDNPLR